MPTISLPTPGTTTGPGWASQLNTAITAVNTATDANTANLTGTFNVMAYGATGNGTTNDAPAIQAAIDAAAGGGTVVFPPGNYGISATLVLQAGITLRGYGATIHRLAAAVGLSMANNFTATDTTTAAYAGRSNITILGLTWDGHGDTLTSAGSNMVTFNHATNIRVRDCRFLRCIGFHSLEMNSIDGGFIDGCTFEGYQSFTGLVDKEAIQIDCANSGAVNSGLTDGTPAINISVTNCVFKGFGAMPSHPVGVGSHGLSNTGAYYENISISNIIHLSPSTRGVGGYYWKNANIQSVKVVNPAQQGIRLFACLRSTVANSTVFASTPASTQAISFNIVGTDPTQWCVASGNVVEGTNEGIVFRQAKSCIAVGNITRNTASYGITMDGTTDCSVLSNHVLGAGYTAGALGAIRVSNANGTISGTAVANNVVRPHGAGTEVTNGVSIATATNTWVFGNDFKGIATAIAGTADTTSNRI